MSALPKLPFGEAFLANVRRRRLTSNLWQYFFLLALIIGLIALFLLAYNIVNRVFTVVAIENSVEPESLADVPLDELSEAELVALLAEESSPTRLKVFIFRDILGAPDSEWAALNQALVGDTLESNQYPEGVAQVKFADLEPEQTAEMMSLTFSQETLLRLIQEEIIQPRVQRVWPLWDVIFNRDKIDQFEAENPQMEIRSRTWIDLDFLTNPMNSVPELAGLRTAILGSMWIIIITILFAFPIGVGAAIYLEEYASDNFINRVIQLNITNLAGVPSIIYGILGLVIFVRALDDVTSGRIFGALDADATISGRTILSAGLTLGLLILPILIISAQEALKAVPPSLKEAAYGMGATKWEMIYTVLLPNAMPGILTGTILAVSRAFGETAPLVVVGSISRITVDPEGPFSRFTTIPQQIYTWTQQPQDEFRSIAGAAIIVLLVVLLSLNATAIVLRNRLSRKY
jgi:phosphate transport system permease protein